MLFVTYVIICYFYVYRAADSGHYHVSLFLYAYQHSTPIYSVFKTSNTNCYLSMIYRSCLKLLKLLKLNHGLLT